MMDKFIIVVDMGKVVKSIMDVESDRRCICCFVLFHGICNHYFPSMIDITYATIDAVGKSIRRCICVRGNERSVVSGVKFLFLFGYFF